MKKNGIISNIGFTAAALLLARSVSAASLLNVSYDVTREFFKDYNDAFTVY